MLLLLLLPVLRAAPIDKLTVEHQLRAVLFGFVQRPGTPDRCVLPPPARTTPGGTPGSGTGLDVHSTYLTITINRTARTGEHPGAGGIIYHTIVAPAVLLVRLCGAGRGAAGAAAAATIAVVAPAGQLHRPGQWVPLAGRAVLLVAAAHALQLLVVEPEVAAIDRAETVGPGGVGHCLLWPVQLVCDGDARLGGQRNDRPISGRCGRDRPVRDRCGRVRVGALVQPQDGGWGGRWGRDARRARCHRQAVRWSGGLDRFKRAGRTEGGRWAQRGGPARLHQAGDGQDGGATLRDALVQPLELGVEELQLFQRFRFREATFVRWKRGGTEKDAVTFCDDVFE